MGTTVGICSVIGFLPDVFVYPIVGHWRDTLPTADAYRNMADGPRRAVHGDPLYLLLFRKIRRTDAATEREASLAAETAVE